MAVTRQMECAEAICAALHELHFTFLGETDDNRITWFTRGERPKQIRVGVNRSRLLDGVTVTYEWPNLSTGEVLHGQDSITIPVDGSVNRESMLIAAEVAVIHALEVFKDVIEGKGVAGRDALAPYTHGGARNTDG